MQQIGLSPVNRVYLTQNTNADGGFNLQLQSAVNPSPIQNVVSSSSTVFMPSSLPQTQEIEVQNENLNTPKKDNKENSKKAVVLIGISAAALAGLMIYGGKTKQANAEFEKLVNNSAATFDDVRNFSRRFLSSEQIEKLNNLQAAKLKEAQAAMEAAQRAAEQAKTVTNKAAKQTQNSINHAQSAANQPILQNAPSKAQGFAEKTQEAAKKSQEAVSPIVLPENTQKTAQPQNVSQKVIQQEAQNAQNAASGAQAPVEQTQTFESKVQVSRKQYPMEIEKLGNGRISVTFIKGKKTSRMELPEYLYHVTSFDNMQSILQTRRLNKTSSEQLNGTYLLDSRNFLEHYRDLENHDLITAIFSQATKARKKTGGKLADQKVCIIKVPTEELLRRGKMRVRKQSDFFSFQEKIASLTSNFPCGKMSARSMCKTENREKLRQCLATSGMDEKEIQAFMQDMEAKLHHGYTLGQAGKYRLEFSEPIEYIYNHDIEFDEIKGISYRAIELANIMTQNDKGRDIVDLQKLSKIFG